MFAFPNKYISSYPLKDDPRCVSASIGDVLKSRYSDDAHFAGYEADLVRRHSIALFQNPVHADKIDAVNLRMVLAVFDIDGPQHAVTDEWRAAEALKVEALRADHPGIYAYDSRGGYRLIGLLPEPYALRSQADDDAWTALYLSWVRYLARRYGIAADVSCSDWTRLYRAPNVVRDGVRQDRAASGNPDAIGVWAPKTTKRDRAVPVRVSTVGAYGYVAPVPMSNPENAYGLWRIKEALKYLAAAPRVCFSTSGNSRRDVMFRICCILVRRMRLPLDVAGDLLEVAYNPRLERAGMTPWNRSEPGDYGMSLDERLSQACETGSIQAGDVMDEDLWNTLNEAAS